MLSKAQMDTRKEVDDASNAVAEASDALIALQAQLDAQTAALAKQKEEEDKLLL